MKAKIALWWSLIVVISALIGVAAVSIPQAAEPALFVSVKDIQGKIYRVSAFYVKYVAEGIWIGGSPEETPPSLKISLILNKNRVTSEERLEFPFVEVQRIVFEGIEVPKVVQPTMGVDNAQLLVELRDGRKMVFGHQHLVELMSDGSQKKKEYSMMLLTAGEFLGMNMPLSGFGGRSKNETGSEGDFSISRRETASIEFD